MKPKDDSKIEEIFEATLQLVKEHGLSGITVNMIAKKAGFATGTVYTYFENKEQLILKLFDRCFSNYARDYFAGFDPTAPFKVAFHTIWVNMIRHSMDRFSELVFIEQCFHSPYISEESRATYKEVFLPWKEMIEKGKREGLVKQLDVMWLMLYVRGTIREIVKYVQYNQLQITPEFIEQMFNMCWDGIKD
ncbi:transcriptional regulator, TetR family [Filimonas lacunae]|uniref:Transcriptional regulator, TetR family n=1 Tax=Filimonas lacunae TaxID=477680 RepID=A0A173MNR8_9BACT|nr:TetR/AcrR family transcriptional regulator [Filimonas lacunae]BAV09284.1 transcriptional regulator, TetR family [Filimonas lacunae]SIS70454.1 transcriptional regulator, TetR family [Filimonas lacunae]